MNIVSVTDLIRALAWPVVAAVALVVFRVPMVALFRSVGQRATKLSVLNVSVELSSVAEFQPPPAFDQIRELTSDLGLQSSESSLFQQLESTNSSEFVIIDLGTAANRRWLTSRLYIFGLMLERMRGIRCIVFVESTDEKRRRYAGCALPANVRWSLAARYPWLEQAYVSAVSLASARPDFQVLSQWGTLPAGVASQIVQQFLAAIRMYPGPNVTFDNEWVEVPGKGYWEHGRWIDVPRLERLLGISFFNATVPASPDIASDEIARRILRRSVPFVARVSEDNRLETLVDRADLLEQLAVREGKNFLQ